MTIKTMTDTALVSRSPAFETTVEVKPSILDKVFAAAPKGRTKVSAPAGQVCRPVKLEEVLYDQRYPPFTREDFVLYLQREHSEENLAYWLAVERFKEDNDSDPKRFNEILETFIEEGSPSEVNIPSKMRTDLLTIRDEGKEIDPSTVFLATQTEVEHLMESDSFKRFFKYSLMNLPKRHIKWRYTAAALSFVLGAGMAVMLCILQGPNLVVQETTFVTSRWFRVVVLLPFFLMFNFLLSARAKVCPGLALRGVKMSLPNVSYMATMLRGNGGKVEDSYANQEIRKISFRILRRAVVYGVLVTAVVVALPPGYGQGVDL